MSRLNNRKQIVLSVFGAIPSRKKRIMIADKMDILPKAIDKSPFKSQSKGAVYLPWRNPILIGEWKGCNVNVQIDEEEMRFETAAPYNGSCLCVIRSDRPDLVVTVIEGVKLKTKKNGNEVGKY